MFVSKFTSLAATGLATTLLVATSQGATIAEFSFTDQVDGAVDAVDFGNSAAALTGISSVSDLSLGAKLAGNLATSPNLVHSSNGAPPDPADFKVSFSTNGMRNDGGHTDFMVITGGAASNSEANALLEGSFVQFDFTVSGGYQADLTTLTFEFDQNNSNATQVPRFFYVAVNDAKIGATLTAPGTDPKHEFISFDLSAAPIVTGNNNVKVFIFTGGSSDNDRNGQFDEFTLNGEVTLIPEPASLALLGLRGLCLLSGRRRSA